MTDAAVAGLVLAGGQGSRLGAAVPKPLVDLDGKPLIAHVLARFPPWIRPILVGANDVPAFAGLGHPVVADRLTGFQGPLAALDAAAAYLRLHHGATTHLLALPGDTPFLPGNIADLLTTTMGDIPRIARHADRLEPGVGLWPLGCLDDLPAYLAATKDRSIRGFFRHASHERVEVDSSSAGTAFDPFFNVNSPADLERARAAFVD